MEKQIEMFNPRAFLVYAVFAFNGDSGFYVIALMLLLPVKCLVDTGSSITLLSTLILERMADCLALEAVEYIVFLDDGGQMDIHEKH
jgi:hypothetical protein